MAVTSKSPLDRFCSRTTVTRLPIVPSAISSVVFAVICRLEESWSVIFPFRNGLDDSESVTTPVKCRVRTGLVGTARIDLALAPSLITPTNVPVVISEMEGDSRPWRAIDVPESTERDMTFDSVLRVISEGDTEFTVPNNPDWMDPLGDKTGRI